MTHVEEFSALPQSPSLKNIIKNLHKGLKIEPYNALFLKKETPQDLAAYPGCDQYGVNLDKLNILRFLPEHGFCQMDTDLKIESDL